ncbi:hypothetical protein CBF34_00690 [Vagococcus penaei]|uniref:Uncharacterized protein n=1 Tax=Vagococcus penaei TaxID=633807 RepID=A0A1Q2D5C9_9ENTE|nr:YxeA family protein [Vagococcus penaei]AQP53612.1 hypothetical protein BW732_04770 [Vagococcus penaei]RSU07557.1 hypothetical protein CBF34_00690 [Vagococcus penaei]
MKKVGLTILTLVILLGGAGSYYFYQNYVRGTYYYTQVINEGKQIDMFKEDGTPMGDDYEYNQLGYDKDGQSKELEFHANKQRPLKLKAYLKLKINPNKGNLSWEEVTEKDVPAAALKKLEETKSE